MSQKINRVVILGGGSAGWLTAGVLAAEHKTKTNPDISITLVESPDVQIIGVGEGTWPSMRDTLQRMGVSEAEFLIHCDASFKQGSKFSGWVSGEKDDYYYHPFSAPEGFGKTNLASAWANLEEHPRFADLVSFQPHLCESGKAPKQVVTPEFAAVANYAYHLDAGKFGQFLQQHCTDKLGVGHMLAHVAEVECDDDGDITGLRTDDGKLIEGDLFIDCTGFASLLIGKHYDVPFISTRDILFCDSALATQVPYPYENSPIASQTNGTAQQSGWVWDIGLPTRRGVGYVYSSAHTSDEDAEFELWGYIGRSGGPGDEIHQGSARKITFNPGYRQKFWHRNCVAVGISAGFVEPLEASAIALIEMSARMIADEWPATRELMDISSRRFNHRFEYRWERIIEFLKLHYLLSNRTDSKFWTDNRKHESVPDRLAELLEIWRYRSPGFRDFHELEEVFPSASYQYVLYGMGFKPDPNVHQRRLDQPEAALQCFQVSRQLAKKYQKGLPSNRELIDHIARYGMKRI
ncbi:MAG TPA: tryptophan halogenase family protein [Xanthomonadales bacterium]|nr:tryptophan halogenase family protein [Xanthomonadales bacterium]